jgi:gliding motility-associated lipoprotein GldH
LAFFIEILIFAIVIFSSLLQKSVNLFCTIKNKIMLMSKSQRLIVVLILTFTTLSCNQENIIYEKNISFPRHTWQRFNKLDFEFTGPARQTAATVLFNIRYQKNFPYDHVPVYVILSSQSGAVRMREVAVPLRNKKGQPLGSPVDDSLFFDQTAVLWPEILFQENDTIHVNIEQLIPKYTTTGLVHAGITVRSVP